jgi:hypothetical protein
MKTLDETKNAFDNLMRFTEGLATQLTVAYVLIVALILGLLVCLVMSYLYKEENKQLKSENQSIRDLMEGKDRFIKNNWHSRNN